MLTVTFNGTPYTLEGNLRAVRAANEEEVRSLAQAFSVVGKSEPGPNVLTIETDRGQMVVANVRLDDAVYAFARAGQGLVLDTAAKQEQYVPAPRARP